MEADAVALIERPWPTMVAVTVAFEQLFRAEYARAVRIAYRVVGDQAEAEDVVQEVFLAFYRAHPADAPYAAPWLHRAAAHAALNAVRSRSRRAARDTQHAASRDAVAALQDPQDPLTAALERERAREVRAALARMPRAAAELLALRYSGLSYAEVAAATNTKPDQVGTRLRRAHDAFRKEVSRGQHR